MLNWWILWFNSSIWKIQNIRKEMARRLKMIYFFISFAFFRKKTLITIADKKCSWKLRKLSSNMNGLFDSHKLQIKFSWSYEIEWGLMWREKSWGRKTINTILLELLKKITIAKTTIRCCLCLMEAFKITRTNNE